jgi:hypothetical protein
MIGRRSVLTGIASFLAAPAIVRVDSLMQVRGYILRGSLAAPHWICGTDDAGRKVREYVERNVYSLTRWRSLDAVSCRVVVGEVEFANSLIPSFGRTSTPVALNPFDFHVEA